MNKQENRSHASFRTLGRSTLILCSVIVTLIGHAPSVRAQNKSTTPEEWKPVEETNHVLDESPRVMYMHIQGHGDAVKLAATIHRALSYTKTPFNQSPASLKKSPPAGVDFQKVEKLLGRTGKDNKGVYQFSIARAEKITDAEMEVPPSMGVATAINFQPTGGGHAAIDLQRAGWFGARSYRHACAYDSMKNRRRGASAPSLRPTTLSLLCIVP